MLRQSKRVLCGAATAILLTLSPIYSAHAQDSSASDVTYSVLNPGDFVWQPHAATTGAVEIVVSLPLQVAYVYRGGTLIGVSTISSGAPGNETPTGSFEILQKRRVHHSNLYNNAPMPFMQRLTWDGIALHAGEIPGRPASHGCVRLPMAFARHLFEVTRLGASVHILNESPAPEEAVAYLRERPAGAVQLASGG